MWPLCAQEGQVLLQKLPLQTIMVYRQLLTTALRAARPMAQPARTVAIRAWSRPAAVKPVQAMWGMRSFGSQVRLIYNTHLVLRLPGFSTSILILLAVADMNSARLVNYRASWMRRRWRTV